MTSVAPNRFPAGIAGAIFILSVLTLFSLPEASAQSFSYGLNGRVDTSIAEVKEVLDLWLRYLDSSPDSAYDNPHWNQEERKAYGPGEFDFTGRLMYQMPASDLVRIFKPVILSIEKENDRYAIRTLFYGDKLEGYMARSNPWAITRVHAIRDHGSWKLANALPTLTAEWRKERVGRITYIFPHDHTLDTTLAQRSNDFCDSVGNLLGREWAPFEYYITHSPDELGRILGFDFFFAGYTSGLSMNSQRKILAGFGSEWYPHEFVHMVAGTIRNRMIDEGLATWIGGSGRRVFPDMAKDLGECLSGINSVRFSDVFNQEWGWQCAAFYTTGAILVDQAYKRGGMAAVRRLMSAPDDEREFVAFLSSELGVAPDDFDAAWRAMVARYSD